jgi:hypothetical protein
LIALDVREAAPGPSQQAQAGSIELREIVEPALARWNYRPARVVWLDHLSGWAIEQLNGEPLKPPHHGAVVPPAEHVSLEPTSGNRPSAAGARPVAGKIGWFCGTSWHAVDVPFLNRPQVWSEYYRPVTHQDDQDDDRRRSDW